MIPDVITRYFRAAADDDLDALIACFSEDASVVDEGQTYRGRAAVRQWRTTVAGRWQYTVAVLGCESPADDHHVISTLLEGNFPGGRVHLAFDVRIVDGHITSLVIA